VKVHLERATPAHVQTFAQACPGSDEQLARAAGYAGVLDACLDLLSRSTMDAKALVAGDDVLALAGLYANQHPATMWAHTGPGFKGFGALRVVRLLVDRWTLEHGELGLAVPTDSDELVRLASFLGFQLRGPILNYSGRQYYSTARKAA
jgi:hypothetical protein